MVQGLGFWVLGLGCRVQGAGLGVSEWFSRLCVVKEFGLKVQGSGFRAYKAYVVWGLGRCRVQDSGCMRCLTMLPR
jgi:hypothetical protein